MILYSKISLSKICSNTWLRNTADFLLGLEMNTASKEGKFCHADWMECCLVQSIELENRFDILHKTLF